MDNLNVLIADDHPLFRKGMRALLTATSAITIVGEATTGHEAIELAAGLQPDVILMDLQMPGINGVEATCQILHTSPHIRILVVTLFEDDASVFSALRAGARGSSTSNIARQLSLSVKTVSNYISNIFGKLQVTDRSQAVIRARDAGLA